MTTTVLLRVASVLSVLFAIGHTLGGRKSWSPIGESDVLQAMRTFAFDIGGARRTYLDFYLGFGFTLSVFLLMQAVLLLQLARLAGTDASSARPLFVPVLVAAG